jgi:hypothetical protein
MKDGSHQVEMSDEGLMTKDIDDCLTVVIKALAKCDLPAEEVSPGASKPATHGRFKTSHNF